MPDDGAQLAVQTMKGIQIQSGNGSQHEVTVSLGLDNSEKGSL